MEQGSKTKKIITTTTTSINKREEVPVKTSQSLNTESYEYFSQKITTKNNLTESSLQASNQKDENSSLKCTCNQGSSAKKNFQELKCTCGKGMSQSEQQQICTCGLSHGITGSNQFQIKTTTTTTNYNNVNSNINSGINTNVNTKTRTNINVNANARASSNINANASSNASASANASLAKSGQRISTEQKEINVKTEGKVCNCNQSVNEKVSSKTTINKKSLMMTKEQINKSMKAKQEWNRRNVGQNNENLQIIAAERPELLVQCVQDIKVIQEPRPVQILIPVPPNEIDYPLGLEIYGKEKKVLICPENIDELNVSKAYSTIKPHFEGLDIGQSENVFCEKVQKKAENLNIEHDDLNIKKSKKDRYDMPLTLENGEMFVKGEKNFNKGNEVELTTKMNVIGKQKLPWNETNEAIKTTKMNIDKTERTQFENLYVENNAYNYQGKSKNKFSPEEIDLEQNEDMTYPAEYANQNWNETTTPMSGKPFTIERQEKKINLSKSKGDKITIKKSYETVDWNKKNNKRKEVQINMIKRSKQKHLAKQRAVPVTIKGQENDWNNLVKEENDTNINIEKTAKLNEFDIAHGDEVHISNEAEEILVNDDYNIVEENYTRPVRANIKKVPDFSEESVSSEYDVLKGIKKYMGQYQYKDLVDESLKIQGQKIIINDISGKYPRRVETFQGLDENFQKFSNDQYKADNRNFNVQINQVNIEKRVRVNKQPLHEYKYVQKYEYEQEGDYEHESYERNNNEPEDAQEPEQEMEGPEDKDQGLGQIQIHQRQEHSQEVEAEVEGEGEEEINEHELEEQYPEEEQENENVETKEQYYYLKQNEERNDSEPRDEMEPEQQDEINANEDDAKDTLQKAQDQEDQNEPQETSPKVYIKEITYTKGEANTEGNVANLRYITLKKKEEQEDSNSQPNDHNEEQEEKEIKQQEEIHEEKKEESNEKDNKAQYQYVTMLSQKVEEQHLSKSENDIKSDLEQEIEKKEEINEEQNKEGEKKEEEKKEEQNKEEIKEENKIENQYQYVKMLSQKVEEQHLSRDEGEPDNELDEEIKKKEENNVLESQENQQQVEEHAQLQSQQQEEKHAQIQSQQQVEEHAQQSQQQVEEQVEHHMEEKVEDNNEEQAEENVEEHVEEHVEENVEENVEDNVEEHIEENFEEHFEEHVEDNEEQVEEDNNEEQLEEQVEDNNEEQMEEHVEEHVEEQEEEHLEHQEYEEEVHNEEQNLEQEHEHEQEMQEEEIHQQEQELKIREKKPEIKQEGKKVSEIVAEAIQQEMKRQELKERELRQKGKEDKYNLMINAYSKHLKENPPDNYNKFATNKLNIIPKVSEVQSHPVQTTSKTVQTQTITQSQTSTQQQFEEAPNPNPMMYSFGQGSVEESHLSTENKNAYLVSSGIQGRVFTFGQEGLTTTNTISSGANLKLKNIVNYTQKQSSSSGQGMTGKYYFTKGYSSYSSSSKGNKEPMDNIKRKKMERGMKAKNEMDDIVVGPRDSKRK